MDKVDTFLIKQNLRIERLKKRLDIKVNPAPGQKKPKKKCVTNKNTIYMLFVCFVICIIAFFYFCSSFYFQINAPEFYNPFKRGADYLDYANNVFKL